MDGREGTRYGRRKLGDKVFEAQQARATSVQSASGVVYGPKKGGPKKAAPATPAVTLEEANLDELAALLEADPALLDRAIELELAEGKPRKGALALFRELEEAKPEPRAAVLELLAQGGEGEE